jgi:hypothetical protein
MFELKAALAKFTAAFWTGFEQARARSAPLAPGNPFAGLNETVVKATIEAALRGSYDAGMAAEKARVEAILAAPGAAMFPDLAADLLRGPASAAQAIAVLDRTQTDAAKRAALLKPTLLEASAEVPTLH